MKLLLGATLAPYVSPLAIVLALLICAFASLRGLFFVRSCRQARRHAASEPRDALRAYPGPAIGGDLAVRTPLAQASSYEGVGDDREGPASRASESPHLTPVTSQAPQAPLPRRSSLRRIGSAPAIPSLAAPHAAPVLGPLEGEGNGGSPTARVVAALRLLRHSILGIDIAAAAALFTRVRRLELPPGGVLFREGDQAEGGLCIVMEGALGWWRREPEAPPTAKGPEGGPCRCNGTFLHVLRRGRVIGEDALLSSDLGPEVALLRPPSAPLPLRPGTAIALVATRVLQVDAQTFAWLAQSHARAVVAFILETTSIAWRVAQEALTQHLPVSAAVAAAAEPTEPALFVGEAKQASALRAAAEVRTFQAGEVLVAKGSAAPWLYVILSGTAALVATAEASSPTCVLAAGCLVGGLACFAAAPHSATVTALTRLVALAFPRSAFTDARARTVAHMDVLTAVALAVGRGQAPLLSLFAQLGLRRRWLRAGELVLRANEAQSDLLLLTSGRLRTYSLAGEAASAAMRECSAEGEGAETSGEPASPPRGPRCEGCRGLLGDMGSTSTVTPGSAVTAAALHARILAGGLRVDVGRGEFMGTLAVLSAPEEGAAPRLTTAVCIRDAEMVTLSRSAFDMLAVAEPRLLYQLARGMARLWASHTARLAGGSLPLASDAILHAATQAARSCGGPQPAAPPLSAGVASICPESPFVVITLLGAGADPPPLASFARALVRGISESAGCPVLLLTSRAVDEALGAGTAQGSGEVWVRARVSAWLSQQERSYRFVVLQADDEGSLSQPRPHPQRSSRSRDDDEPGSVREVLPHVRTVGSALSELGSTTETPAGAALHRAVAKLAAELSTHGGRGSGYATSPTLVTESALLAELESAGLEQRRVSPWSDLAVQQADLLLLVGTAHTPATLSVGERHCAFAPPPASQGVSGAGDGHGHTAPPHPVPRTFAVRELVLLHPDARKPPLDTRAWLRLRACSQHHHVRSSEPGDTARVARFVTYRAHGLVLGGGGARGVAHVGVLRAFEAAGVPVDVIGGTSQGAFCAAAYASSLDSTAMERVVRRLARELSSASMLVGLTLPLHAWFSGSSFNVLMCDAFGSVQMEDLLIHTFCVTTDVTAATVGVHDSGHLWRYVRASMTVLGVLPPLQSPDAHLLIDGGYVDNLPVDALRALSPACGTIFAVDVENKVNSAQGIPAYGDTLSGWTLLGRYLLSAIGVLPALRMPTLSELALRVSYISHSMLLGQLLARGDPRVVYMLIPVGSRFSLFEYGSAELIIAAGHASGAEALAQWRRRGQERSRL